MSDYARRHHPQVQARKLSSGKPLLNSWDKDGWRKKLAAEFGFVAPSKMGKAQLYRAWLALAALKDHSNAE